MKMAIAAMAPGTDAQIAEQGARAPFFLLFDEKGELLEALSNPFSAVDRGAAPQAVVLLANKGVTLLVAGAFGQRFVSELRERGIEHVRLSGQVADVMPLLNR